MRITQDYSIQSLLTQVNNTRDRISTLQRNLATGKRINQISDDPGGVETALRYRSILKFNAQYQKNINEAREFLIFTSNALEDSSDIITTIKELTIQGIDSTGTDEFDAIVQQLDELIAEFVDTANTKFKNRYVFGGSNVTTEPFLLSPDYSAVIVNPEGVDGEIKTELGAGNVDSYNITGQEVYLENSNVFQTLLDVRTAFVNRDTTTLSGLIPDLDDALDQVLSASTKAGAQVNRLDLLLQNYQNEDLRLQEFLSSVEDTNMPETIVSMQMEQTALQTALETLAKTVNISILDFI
jgi:flagellar hook-associated protein 3 FlgL